MAAFTIHQASVAPVKIYDQITAPAASSLSAGDVVRYNDGGSFVTADAGAASTASAAGICLTTVTSGFAATALADGIIDVGGAVSHIAYGNGVFMGDELGSLSAASGTVEMMVGRVRPGFGFPGTNDKVLRVSFGFGGGQIGAKGD
jgi:hypothetical protein